MTISYDACVTVDTIYEGCGCCSMSRTTIEIYKTDTSAIAFKRTCVKDSQLDYAAYFSVDEAITEIRSAIGEDEYDNHPVEVYVDIWGDVRFFKRQPGEEPEVHIP